MTHRKTRVAAIQIATRSGQLQQNLDHIDQLVAEALGSTPAIIALPEFFTGALAPCEEAFRVALPAQDNVALRFLKDVARKHGTHVGGSMLVADGDNLYNRYYFVAPSGQVHTHDKDLPTMWENAFYVGGSDDGVFATDLGTIGAGVCWELIRNQTVKRMLGRVELAISGTHWWSLPVNWPLAPRLLASLVEVNRRMSEQAPAEFARRIRAPVIQASHSGRLRGDFYLAPGISARLPYDTEFVGATQIVAADGTVIASRNTHDGPGVVIGEIEIGRDASPGPPADLESFWIPDLPLFHRLYWAHQNVVNRSVYRRQGRKLGTAAAARNAAVHSPPVLKQER